MNTDNNGYLTKDEFFEAAKVSPDMQALNFSYKQLENLVDGLIAIGDQVNIILTNFTDSRQIAIILCILFEKLII